MHCKAPHFESRRPVHGCQATSQSDAKVRPAKGGRYGGLGAGEGGEKADWGGGR